MNGPGAIRVLIAEDEDSFRMVLERVLASEIEFDFEACESGEEVIEALNRKTFDVVILDYKMPGRSGLNILQWVHEQKMDTPVVLLTGAGSETIAVEAMKLGAYDYVRKDTFEKEHLPFIIRNAYQQYLFKRESEFRKQMQDDKSKTAATLELLLNCMRSFGELMNTSLAVVNMELETREKELKQYMTDEGSTRLAKTYDEMRRQYEIIAMSTKSMLDLTKVMFDRFAAGIDTSATERELRRSLQDIEGYSGRRSNRAVQS